MPVASIRLVGEKELRRNLTALERQVLPRAKANAINRAATRARKDAISEFARTERRKKKAFRSILRVMGRARARVREQAIVILFARQQPKSNLSAPFQAKGKTYRRRLDGRQWTKGRPRTSSPNLPIYSLVDEVSNRRARITRKECVQAMRQFYPAELRAQLKKLIEKHIRRRAR